MEDQEMYEEPHNMDEGVEHNGEMEHEGHLMGHHGTHEHLEEAELEPVMGADMRPGKRFKVKRCRTGYMFFVQENRKRVTEENPDLMFGQISTKVSGMWKALTPEERAPYELKAAEDRERWTLQKENPELIGQHLDAHGIIIEIPPPKKRGRKRKERKWSKEIGSPKKAMTPYIAFGKGIRDEVTRLLTEADPSTKPTDIMKEISARWNKITPEERARFEEIAAKDRVRYEEQRKEWDASHPPDERSAKRSKRDDGELPRPKKVAKVRAQGETEYDKIPLTLNMSIGKLIQKILRKRQEPPSRTISTIIQLPDIRLRDTEDITSLPHEAELEFIWGPDQDPAYQIEEMEEILTAEVDPNQPQITDHLGSQKSKRGRPAKA